MSDKMPQISMVAATMGRSVELQRLIDSLSAQHVANFELIIVDQNSDNRVAEVLAIANPSFPVNHMRINPQGACFARNAGAAQALGQWIMFPDDDCWYPQDFTEKLRTMMATYTRGIYSGRAVNATGKTIMGAFPDTPEEITRETIWTTLIEWLTLFRADVFHEVGGFDVRMGPGAKTPWAGYEIQDIVLRCLAKGATGRFDPSLFAYHPEDTADQTTSANVEKMRLYSQGKGLVMHRYGFPAAYVAKTLIRPLAGMLVYTATGRFGMARRSKALFLGYLYGWRHFKAG